MHINDAKTERAALPGSSSRRRPAGAAVLVMALLAALMGLVSTVGTATSAQAQNSDPIAQAAAGNFTLDNFDRQQVIDAYNNIVVPAQNRTPSWTGSVAGCNAGSVSASYLEGALALVNYFREYAADLEPAVFDTANNAKAQQASLVFRANNVLAHDLPNNLTCWTQAAADGASSSNIGFGYRSLATITTGYMVDPGANNIRVGHRRWIISPTVRTMGMGATVNTNALWVVDSRDTAPPPAGTPAVITWPPKGFMHEDMVPDRWSISILQENLNTRACRFQCIDWSNSDVTVKVNGQTVSSNVIWTDQFGVIGPTLVVEPAMSTIRGGTADRNVEVTVTYENNGQPQTYRWTTTVIDPSYNPPAPTEAPVYAPGDVSTAVQPNGRTVVVVRDANNLVWTRTQTTAGGSAWTSWKNLGGCVTDVDTAVDAGGRVTIAAIGCGGRAGFIKRQTSSNNTTWTGWSGIGGCVEDVALAANANGRLTVAATGCGGKATFMRTQNDDAGSSWSNWQSVGGCAEQIAMEQQANGRMVLAAIGCGSNSVFVRTQSTANGFGWQPWQSLGGCTEQISLAAGSNDKLTVAGIGCGSRALFVRSQTAQNATSWTGWQSLGGCVRQIDMGAGLNGALTVAAIGCGGNTAFSRSETGSGGWFGWKNQGGCVQNVAVADAAGSKVTITGVGCGAHSLFFRTQASGGSTTWTGWSPLGGTIGLA